MVGQGAVLPSFRLIRGDVPGRSDGRWAVSLVVCSALAYRCRLHALVDWDGRERLGVER